MQKTTDQIVFRPGMRSESAVQQFRDQINGDETIHSTEKRAQRKLLLRLQPLLADPISADQAQALDDTFQRRHKVEDLIEWLKSPPMSWGQFPEYQREQEEVRREQLWQQWKNLEERWDAADNKPEICPSCGARSVVRISYGLPDEVGEEAARRGAIVLGGCMLVEDAAKWYCRNCGHEWGKLFGDDDELFDDHA